MNLQQNLGALEFNGAIIESDAALERIASAGPTTMGGCPTLMCRHIEDSRLEQAATVSAQPYTSPMNFACRHIEDGALEQTASTAQPQTIAQPWCHHIGDGALEDVARERLMTPTRVWVNGSCRAAAIEDGRLEQAGERLAGPPVTAQRACPYVDDGALEQAGERLAGPPPTVLGYPSPACRHIDDSALEQAAAEVQAGPKTIIFPGSNTRCV